MFQPDAKIHTVHNIGEGFVDAQAAVEHLLASTDEETDGGSDFPGNPPEHAANFNRY